ncbi:MAG: DMT family transporter [Alphaproteobacteria bacterium]|nr:DMT family transporter [Alphaproteobacteria bacterium]
MLKTLARLDPSASAPLPASVRGALWMSAGAAFFAVMINLVRHLTDQLDPLQVVFFRNAFGLLAVLPWLLRGGMPALHTRRIGLHVLRALFGIAAMLLWFNTLARMPLAEATALSFTAPIFTSILAVFFLGEIMRKHRWLAIAMGFLGAMIIIRPGVAALDPIMLLAVVTALVWGSSTVLLKYMSRTETTSAMVIYLPLFLTPISFVPATFVWTWPTPELWLIAILFGAVGTLGHYCLTRALSTADAGAVMPFDYLRLPFVAIIAYLAFGESADLWVWLGGALIAAGALYNTHSESRSS